jgi:hypothetical protein
MSDGGLCLLDKAEKESLPFSFLDCIGLSRMKDLGIDNFLMRLPTATLYNMISLLVPCEGAR